MLFKNWVRKCLQYMYQRYSYQIVWAKGSALQLSDILATKSSQNLKWMSSEEQYWRHQPSFPYLLAEAHITKQSNACLMWTDRSSVWRKDCWSELDFRQGKKFQRSAKLDSWLKHCIVIAMIIVETFMRRSLLYISELPWSWVTLGQPLSTWKRKTYLSLPAEGRIWI